MITKFPENLPKSWFIKTNSSISVTCKYAYMFALEMLFGEGWQVNTSPTTWWWLQELQPKLKQWKPSIKTRHFSLFHARKVPMSHMMFSALQWLFVGLICSRTRKKKREKVHCFLIRLQFLFTQTYCKWTKSSKHEVILIDRELGDWTVWQQSCIIRTHVGKWNSGDSQKFMEHFHTSDVNIYALWLHKELTILSIIRLHVMNMTGR